MTQPASGAQSGTGEGAQSGADPTGQGTPGTDPNNPTGQGAGEGQGQQQPADPPRTVSQAEYDALQNRLRAADQNRTKAEAELQQLKDKDIPALEKATRDLTAMTQRAEKAEADLRESRIQNAFLSDNKYTWNNPATALRIADLSKVEVGEDGTVSNLVAALDALAKSDPYLLKPAETKEEEPKGSTGAPGSGNNRKPGDGKPDLAAMASRFPAMRGRTGH